MISSGGTYHESLRLVLGVGLVEIKLTLVHCEFG